MAFSAMLLQDGFHIIDIGQPGNPGLFYPGFVAGSHARRDYQ
jgi:hypothetical protein